MDVSGVHFTVSTKYFFLSPFFFIWWESRKGSCDVSKDKNSMKDVEIDNDLINSYEQARVMWLEKDVTMIQRENVSEF